MVEKFPAPLPSDLVLRAGDSEQGLAFLSFSLSILHVSSHNHFRRFSAVNTYLGASDIL